MMVSTGEAKKAMSTMIRTYLRFAIQLKIACSKLQAIFDRKECGLFYDSLAFAVQAAMVF